MVFDLVVIRVRLLWPKCLLYGWFDFYYWWLSLITLVVFSVFWRTSVGFGLVLLVWVFLLLLWFAWCWLAILFECCSLTFSWFSLFVAIVFWFNCNCCNLVLRLFIIILYCLLYCCLGWIDLLCVLLCWFEFVLIVGILWFDFILNFNVGVVMLLDWMFYDLVLRYVCEFNLLGYVGWFIIDCGYLVI